MRITLVIVVDVLLLVAVVALVVPFFFPLAHPERTYTEAEHLSALLKTFGSAFLLGGSAVRAHSRKTRKNDPHN